MVFILLSFVFAILFFVFEDTEQKRIKKEVKDWKRIMGYDYYG